ncbi:uncharacterized protein [Dermacentor albipictus]|uniref:uncharacterized protein n=1 Tax=Dermacentor albipictus TaxID=60249 RepID=UPI0038FD25AD
MRAAGRRAPCPQHPCSPSYPGSPAAQWGCAPCPVHDAISGGDDDDEYGHDPLFFDPRHRGTVRSPEKRAQQHLTRKIKYGKQYDSHIHERRLRDQRNLEHGPIPEPSGTTLDLPPPKPVGSTRASPPTYAGRQALTSKEQAGHSARHPSLLQQPRAPVLGHPGELQQQLQPVQLWQPQAISIRMPSVSKSVPTSSKHQVGARVQATQPAVIQPRASVPSARVHNQVQEHARLLAASQVTPRANVDERLIQQHRKRRGSYSKWEYSDSSGVQMKDKKKKKEKKKKKHKENAIVVSTPSGPFSPGTKTRKKSHKALKKAQELWQFSHFVGTCCLIFEIIGTIIILLAAMYWLIPKPDEEPISKIYYADEDGEKVPPLMPANFIHGGAARNAQHL